MQAGTPIYFGTYRFLVRYSKNWVPGWPATVIGVDFQTQSITHTHNNVGKSNLQPHRETPYCPLLCALFIDSSALPINPYLGPSSDLSFSKASVALARALEQRPPQAEATKVFSYHRELLSLGRRSGTRLSSAELNATDRVSRGCHPVQLPKVSPSLSPLQRVHTRRSVTSFVAPTRPRRHQIQRQNLIRCRCLYATADGRQTDSLAG